MALNSAVAWDRMRSSSRIGAGGMGEVYRARDTNAEARRRAEDPAGRIRADRRSAGALQARSADTGVAESSEHRARSTASKIGGTAGGRARDGIRRRADDLIDSGSTRGPDRRSTSAADRAADRRSARGGARAGDRPSRSEAGEHQSASRWHGESAGFRAREARGSDGWRAGERREGQEGWRCRNRRRSRRPR